MDDLKKIELELKQEKDKKNLEKMLQEFFVVYTEIQIDNMINKKTNKYSNDLFHAEKIFRSLLRRYETTDEEKVFYQILGENIGIIKFLKLLYNNFMHRQNFEKQVKPLLDEEDTKNIIEEIFNHPNISQKELEMEIDLSSIKINEYLECLINKGIVSRYGCKNKFSYELTPLTVEMIEIYHKNFISQKDKLNKQTMFSKYKNFNTEENLIDTNSNIQSLRKVKEYGRFKDENITVRRKKRELEYTKL